MSMNKKLECKDHQKRNLQKRSLISISSESYKKFIFWLTFLYMVQTFLKIIWWQFLVPAQNVSSLAVQLYHLRHAILQYNNLVTVVHFTDRNWISKSVYCIYRPWPSICFYQPWYSIFVWLFFVLQLKFVIITVSTYINSASTYM